MDSTGSEGMQGNGAAAVAAAAAAAQSQTRIPPGYRFKPSDEIILKHFLRNKVSEKPNASAGGFIRDINFSQLFETPPNRFDFEGNNAKEIMTVADGKGFWKFRGNSYAVPNEDGEFIGLKRDAVYYRIRFGSNPTTKLPKRTHWAMDIYQLPMHFEQASTSHVIVKGVEKWSVVRIRRGKSYEWRKLDDPRYYRFRKKKT